MNQDNNTRSTGLFLLCFGIVSLSLMGCREDSVYLPKPRTYPKISFPERDYASFELDQCDFSFDYPTYATIEKDKEFFEEDISSECWFDIRMDNFNGTLHCTHYEMKGQSEFDELVADAFKMVGKHHIKADYRDEFVISKDNHVGGIMFELQGPVACPLQFFVTDSTSNFLRGALYFNNQVAPDSMAPIHAFVKEDVLKIVESFEWK